MKKSHSHDQKSDRACRCGKKIKARMVEQKDARRCYGCFCKKEGTRGHTINTQPRKKRIVAGLPVKTFR